MIPQIPTAEILHQKIEVIPVLECRLHVDDEGTLYALEDELLVSHQGNTLLLDDFCLRYFFHGQRLASFLVLHLPDVPETS